MVNKESYTIKNILYKYIMTELNPNILIQDITGEINLYAPIDIIDPDTGELISTGTSKLSRINPDGLGLFNNLIDSSRLSGVILNAVGFAYDNLASIRTITWENITTKIEAIQAITQASNATTLNVNNAISIQNGETISVPTQYVEIIADNSGNRLCIDGNCGLPNQILLSGGDDGSLSWGTGGGGLAGTLSEVLNNGNIANRNLDMNGYMIENAVLELDSLNVATDPIPSPVLNSTGSVLPIVLNGTTYYLQLFSVPP